MEPSADTYVTLITGYVEKGQVEKFNQVCQSNLFFVFLLMKYKLKIVFDKVKKKGQMLCCKH